MYACFMGSFLVEKVTFETRMCIDKIIKYMDIIP